MNIDLVLNGFSFKQITEKRLRTSEHFLKMAKRTLTGPGLAPGMYGEPHQRSPIWAIQSFPGSSTGIVPVCVLYESLEFRGFEEGRGCIER